MGKEPPPRYGAGNIDAWWRLHLDDGLDAIVTTTSGCGTTLKGLRHLLARDPAYADKAASLAALTATWAKSRRFGPGRGGRAAGRAGDLSRGLFQHGQAPRRPKLFAARSP